MKVIDYQMKITGCDFGGGKESWCNRRAREEGEDRGRFVEAGMTVGGYYSALLKGPDGQGPG